MNKKVTVGITLAFIFIAVALPFTGTLIFSMNLFDQKIVAIQEREKMYEKVSEIDSFIRSNYYLSVDDDSVMDGLARGYISGVGDTDIKYMTKNDIDLMNDRRTGKMCGIGVETEVDASGYVKIAEVYSNTSAEKVGIEAGDIIIKVNDEDALALGAEAVNAAMFGPAGSEVTLTYTREGTDYSFAFVYENYETRSIQTYDVNGYVYFRILAFNDVTLGQFQDTLAEKLAAGTAKGLVFDLRDTNGGYDMNVIANILDKLVPQCTLVSGIYQGGITKVLFTSDSNSVDLPMAVIVNAGTKGYSELFAAVMGEQDNVRIVGVQTSGLGTYSVLDQLPDGTGIYVPVCELLACGTMRYNDTGVIIDFVAEPSEGFVLEEGEPNIETDLQLRKTLEVLQSEFGFDEPTQEDSVPQDDNSAGSDGGNTETGETGAEG